MSHIRSNRQISLCLKTTFALYFYLVPRRTNFILFCFGEIKIYPQKMLYNIDHRSVKSKRGHVVHVDRPRDERRPLEHVSRQPRVPRSNHFKPEVGAAKILAPKWIRAKCGDRSRHERSRDSNWCR